MKKIYNSILQLVIGILMIWFAYTYIISHPVELQAFQSSFGQIYDKITNIFGSKDNEITQLRKELIKNINELQSIEQTAKCKEYTGTLEALSVYSKELYTISDDILSQDYQKYQYVILQHKDYIDNYCKS